MFTNRTSPASQICLTYSLFPWLIQLNRFTVRTVAATCTKPLGNDSIVSHISCYTRKKQTIFDIKLIVVLMVVIIIMLSLSLLPKSCIKRCIKKNFSTVFFSYNKVHDATRQTTGFWLTWSSPSASVWFRLRSDLNWTALPLNHGTDQLVMYLIQLFLRTTKCHNN